MRLKTTPASRVDLVNLKKRAGGFRGYTVHEGWDDPVDCEGAGYMLFQLVECIDRWLLQKGSPRLIEYYTVRLQHPTICSSELVCR